MVLCRYVALCKDLFSFCFLNLKYKEKVNSKPAYALLLARWHILGQALALTISFFHILSGFLWFFLCAPVSGQCYWWDTMVEESFSNMGLFVCETFVHSKLASSKRSLSADSEQGCCVVV